jgi:Protein of unknown function (DUF2721)
VDRFRQATDVLRGATPEEQKRWTAQLAILVRRARLLRATISFAVLSVLLAAILAIALFLTAFLHVKVVVLCAFLFVTCLLSLIISLLLFLQDINLSLAVLKLELEQDWRAND